MADRQADAAAAVDQCAHGVTLADGCKQCGWTALPRDFAWGRELPDSPIHVLATTAGDEASRVRKPTGTTGRITVGGGEPPTFHPIIFPRSKVEVERFILEGALRCACTEEEPPWQLAGPPVQNEESNLDFSLPTWTGPELMELVEVAPLHAVHGGYGGAAGRYHQGEFADAVLAVIAAKSSKYGRAQRASRHLLLYTTDWRFHLSGGVLLLAQKALLRQPSGFRTVTYYRPTSQEDGQLVVLFPVNGPSEEMRRLDERALRQQLIMSADPTQLRVESDKTFVVPVGVPSRSKPRKSR